jgi:hypothetical protein
MKKLFLLFLTASLFTFDLSAQTQTEYKIVTVVESIIPAGIGRSRIIEEQDEADSASFTTARTDGTDSRQDDVRRKDLKVDSFEETKLLNFFSLGGINFQNVASNDAIITDKLNTLTAEGWELAFVTSGVESSCGGDDGEGIFITRFVFKR